MTKWIRSLPALAVGLNVAWLVVALSMGIAAVVWAIENNRGSRLPELAVIFASPFVVGALVALGLLLWLGGQRWWLAVADAFAIAVSWTVFAFFVLLSDLPFVTPLPFATAPLSILAEAATLVAIAVLRDDDSRGRELDLDDG